MCVLYTCICRRAHRAAVNTNEADSLNRDGKIKSHKRKKGQICDVVGGVSLTAQFIYHKTGGEDILITYTHHEEAKRKNGEIWEWRRMRWRKREWWERRRRDRRIKERGELVVRVFVRKDNWAFSSTLPMTGVTFSIGAHTLLSVCVYVCVQGLSPLNSISIKHTHKNTCSNLLFW